MQVWTHAPQPLALTRMALSVTYGSVATGHGQLPLQQFFHSSPNKSPNKKSPPGQDMPGKCRHSPPLSGPSSQENQQVEYLGVKFHHLPLPSELSSQEAPQVASSGVTLPCSAAEATSSLVEPSIGPSLPTQLGLPGDQPRKGSGPARTCADSSSVRTQWAGSCSLDGRHIEKGEAAGRGFPAEGCLADQALHMDDNLAEYGHVADAKDAAAESVHASSRTPQGVSEIDGNAHVDHDVTVQVLDRVHRGPPKRDCEHTDLRDHMMAKQIVGTSAKRRACSSITSPSEGGKTFCSAPRDREPTFQSVRTAVPALSHEKQGIGGHSGGSKGALQPVATAVMLTTGVIELEPEAGERRLTAGTFLKGIPSQGGSATGNPPVGDTPGGNSPGSRTPDRRCVTVTAVSQDSQLQGGAVTGGHCPRNVLLARTCVPKAASSEGLPFCETSVKAGQSSSKVLLSGGVYGTGGASFDDALLRMDDIKSDIKSSERLSLDSECVTRCTLPEGLPLNGEFMMRRTCPDPLLDDLGARSVEERPCPDTLPLDALGATSLEERRCCLQIAVQNAAAEARASRGSMHCDLRIALALQKQELNRDAATAAGAASSPLRPKAAFVWLSGLFTSCSASRLTTIMLGIVPSYCDITWGLRQEMYHLYVTYSTHPDYFGGF
jgi:hypothetical protein